MFTTLKRSKMVSQLEMDSKGLVEPTPVRSAQSVTGRVVILCFMTWYFGYVFTQMSPMSKHVLQTTFGNFMATDRGTGVCFGLIPLGAAVGVVMAYFVMPLISRRTFLIILNVLNLAFTAALQAGDVYTLFVFRLLQGVLVGNFMTLIPTYISQITPKELGSTYGIYPQISVVLGVLVAFSVGVIMTDSFNMQFSNLTPSDTQIQIFWRVMLIIPIIPSIVQLICIGVGFIPESPYSLIIKNRRDEARDVFRLFYDEQYVEQILQEKQSAIFNQKSQHEQDRVQWTRKGYVLGFLLSIFQVLTGIASFVTQAGHAMSVGLGQPIIGLYTPLFITVAQLIGTFVSVPMLKYIQWRTLILIGGFSLAVLDAALALVFYYYYRYQWQYAMPLALIFLIAFLFIFGVTLGSGVWPYISYMMPNQEVTGALILNWLLAGISIISFAFVTDTNSKNSPYVMLFIYCGITFVLSIVNAVMLIDIKGLSVRRAQLKLQ